MLMFAIGLAAGLIVGGFVGMQLTAAIVGAKVFD
jgi:hypothetical protein